jgi:tRNA pseudouridine55 synthase
MAHQKEYETTIDLSQWSTTDDAEGERTPAPIELIPSRQAVDAAAARFIGIIQQKPPAYSAIKLDGQRAYDLARRGETVDIPARPVMIHALEVLSYEWPTLTIRVTCGKGTYIRSLARDLGAAIGVGGMLTGLRRTRSGDHLVANARTLESLPHAMTQADLLDPPARPVAAATP